MFNYVGMYIIFLFIYLNIEFDNVVVENLYVANCGTELFAPPTASFTQGFKKKW